MPDYPLAMNMYNGLVRYKPNGLEVEPDLAERYEVSKDGLTYTFWLRKGVKFHKGFGDFTARDVKFSFERVADPRVRSPYAPLMKLIREIEIVNDYQVRLHLTEPYADFLPAVLAFRPGYIVSQKAVEQFGAQFGATAAIGTGPYMLDRFSPRQEIVFATHPEYFGTFRAGARRAGSRSHIDRVIFKIIPEETVIALATEQGRTGLRADSHGGGLQVDSQRLPARVYGDADPGSAKPVGQHAAAPAHRRAAAARALARHQSEGAHRYGRGGDGHDRGDVERNPAGRLWPHR